MEERKVSGYIMAGVGFVMILINALSYLLGWDLKSPAFTILGLVLIVIGARTAHRSSWM
jgi:membrane protein implicated in regulation of membrane protease activity